MSLPPSETVERPTRARYWLAGWLVLAAASAYLCRSCLTVAESVIRADLKISEEQMGLIMGLFFWSYALAQIPGGWLGERFGTRRVLPALSAVWSIGTGIWGLATGWLLLVAGRLAVGLAQAGLFPCAVHTASRWYAPTERAKISGILAAAMLTGAAVATALTGLLLDKGWRWETIFAAYAVPGIVWSIGFYLWFREDPAEHPSVNASELAVINEGRKPTSHDAGTVKEAPRVPWAKLATSPAMWMIGLQQFFSAGGIVFFFSWFATYLKEARGVTATESGWLSSIPLLAAVAASLISGSVSDSILRRTGNRSLARRIFAMSNQLICGALLFSAYFIADAKLATVVIGSGIFFAALAAPCSYAVTIDMGGKHVASVFSTMNMFGNVGAGLMPIVVPYFRNFINAKSSLLQLFGGNSWNAVLLLFASMYFAAAFFWMLLRVEGTVFGSESESEEARQ